MAGDLLGIFLKSAEGSFIQVTVFVGLVLLLFGYVDFLQQGAFVESIERSKKYQPLIGALLGILPGCGGSIFLMPLYMKGTVTFGTVIATLIATAGDSAFVTMTQAPKVFVLLTVICFLVGTIMGYIVDYLKIGDWVRKKSPRKKMADLEERHMEAEASLQGTIIDGKEIDGDHVCRSCDLKHIGHEEGDEIDMLLHHTKPLDATKLGYRVCHNYYLVFWLIISLGFILGIIELTQIDINKLPGLPNIGIIMGLIGTIVTLFYMICSRRFIQAQTHEDEEHKLFSIKETLAHNGYFSHI